MDHGQNSVLSLEGSIHEAATNYTASLQSARSDIMVQGSTVGQMNIFGEDERRCGAPMNALRHCPGPVGPFPLAAEWAVEAFWKASYFPEPQPCEIDMSDGG